MNKLRRCCLCVVMFFAAQGIATLSADPTPADVPPPQPPFVKDMPDNSTWTVEMTFKKPPVNPNPGGPPMHIPKARQITKTGDIKREILFYADGTQTPTWYVKSIRLREDTHQHFIEVLDTKAYEQATIQVSRDFEELAWLAGKYYQNVQNEGKRRCYLFRVDVQVDPNNPKPGTGGRYQALVDMDSCLPIKAEDLNCIYTYRYEAAPAGPLTLPAAFQKELDDHLAANKQRPSRRR